MSPGSGDAGPGRPGVRNGGADERASGNGGPGEVGSGDVGSGHRPRPGAWERLYRFVLGLAFPRGYPRRLLDDAARTFARALERRLETTGPGAARRYAVASCLRAAGDGLLEHAQGWRSTLRDLATGWGADLRFAARQLVRRPLAAGVAVLSLAAGIGANTLLFSAVDATLLAPLPVPEPDRVVRIFGPDARATLRSALTPEALETLDREAAALEGVAGVARVEAGLELAGRARLADTEVVTPGYFRVLQVAPARGRAFRPAEAEPGAGRSVVLSHRLWVEATGGDPDAVGRTLRLNRETFTVVGVAPEGFGGSNVVAHADLWVPTGAATLLDAGPRDRREPWLSGIGRLAPGASVADATADVERILADLHRRHPDAYAASGYFVLEERPGLINPARPGLVSLAAAAALAASLLVLLVACVNVAGLTLARVTSRKEELGVRLALGAGRARLVRQMLVETAVLATPAVAAGLWVATVSEDVFGRLVPPLRRLDVSFALDGRMLAFTALCGVAALLVAGILPALLGTRDGVASLLGGRGTRGGVEGPLRAMVGVQVAFSAAILALGGLFYQTLGWYRGAEPGYAVEGRVVVTVDVGLHGLGEAEGRAFFESLVGEARALGAVERAALARGVASGGPALRVVPGAGEEDVRVETHVVSPGYFETLGIDVTDGRAFHEADREDAEPLTVVNRTLARRLAPGASSPVGRLLETRSGEAYRIVGVARDVKYGSLAERARPFAYLPAAQHYRERMALLVHAPGAGTGVVPELRNVVERLRPGLPVVEARSVADFVDEDRFLARAAAALGGGLGGLAVFLALVGLHGTLAFVVQRRRPELAVRMAVGAEPSRIFRDVVTGGLRPVAWGVGVGVPLAVLAALGLRGLLVGASPLDWRVLAGIPLLLGVLALPALLAPASSAASLSPRDALRSE